jgi:hypothetical protein
MILEHRLLWEKLLGQQSVMHREPCRLVFYLGSKLITLQEALADPLLHGWAIARAEFTIKR